MESKKVTKHTENKTKTKKIENVQEKIDWASSLRDVKYSLTFLLRKQSESFSEKKLKGSLGNASDSDLNKTEGDNDIIRGKIITRNSHQDKDLSLVN